MDAAYRAAGTGRVPQQRRLCEALASDAMDVWVGSSLEVAPGQGFLFVQYGYVHRSAQIMILLHHVGGSKLLIDRFKELGVVLPFHKREAAIPDDDDGLQILGPQGSAAAQPPEMAVSVHINARHGALILPRRADAQDAAVA